MAKKAAKESNARRVEQPAVKVMVPIAPPTPAPIIEPVVMPQAEVLPGPTCLPVTAGEVVGATKPVIPLAPVSEPAPDTPFSDEEFTEIFLRQMQNGITRNDKDWIKVGMDYLKLTMPKLKQAKTNTGIDQQTIKEYIRSLHDVAATLPIEVEADDSNNPPELKVVKAE
jgi:hypothetical protein